MELDDGSTEAGSPIGYSLSLLDTDGSSSGVTDYTIASDTEDPLTDDGSALTLLIAGIHTITASADVSGTAQTSTATLEVKPGPLADLDLTLDAEEVVAGAPLGFGVSGSDVYGNIVTAEDVSLTADSTDVVLDSSTATSTAASSSSTGGRSIPSMIRKQHAKEG